MRAKRRFRGAEDRVRRAENAVRVAGLDGAEARLRVRRRDRSDLGRRERPMPSPGVQLGFGNGSLAGVVGQYGMSLLMEMPWL